MSGIPLTRQELRLLGDAERARIRAEVEAATGSDAALLVADLRVVAEDMARVADEIEKRLGGRR
jgi:hypothetical protein